MACDNDPFVYYDGLSLTVSPGTYHACTCPKFWWGVTPPPCAIHNPGSGGTYTTDRLIFGEPTAADAPAPSGWQCPCCKKVWAPSVKSCEKCG